MMNATARALCLALGSVSLPLLACSEHAAHAAVQDDQRPADPLASGSDGSLAAFRQDLLDLAFRAASALPPKPHLKTRSKTQEAVVAACLALDQPRRARRYIAAIDDWRRGTAYADLAYYLAEHGKTTDVQRWLDLAAEAADQVAEDPNPQAWRRDRVRIGIARVHLLLGQTDQAQRFATDAVPAEIGRLDVVAAQTGDAGLFDAQMQRLDAIFATGDFDLSRNALATCAALFDRYYADAERRARIEKRVESAFAKMPEDVRIDALATMVVAALDHQDRDQARDLVERARQQLDGGRWVPERFLPIAARLATLRYRAGEAQRARFEADSALALFDTERDNIVDIYRAAALRPLAEAYAAMDDAGSALMVYKKAAEEGVHNPNSRPRAVDLADLCCSMAVHGVEPDAGFWTRLRAIADGLGDPW